MKRQLSYNRYMFKLLWVRQDKFNGCVLILEWNILNPSFFLLLSSLPLSLLLLLFSLSCLCLFHHTDSPPVSLLTLLHSSTGSPSAQYNYSFYISQIFFKRSLYSNSFHWCPSSLHLTHFHYSICHCTHNIFSSFNELPSFVLEVSSFPSVFVSFLIVNVISKASSKYSSFLSFSPPLFIFFSCELLLVDWVWIIDTFLRRSCS